MDYMTIPGIRREKANYKTMSKSQVYNHVDSIIASSCDQFGLTMAEIKSPSRENRIVIPRMLTMHLLRDKTLLTLEEIGIIFNRHHSTVVSAVTATNNMIQTDELIKEEYQKLAMKV